MPRGRCCVRKDAQCWHNEAERLADWALERIFVRTTRFGGYYTNREGELATSTRPNEGCKEEFSRDVVIRHFRATRREDVLGAHPLTPGNSLGCWVVADIDAHNPEDDPERNERYAKHLYAKVRALGFNPLVLTWGQGSFHVWIFFTSDLPGSLLHAFGKWIVRDAMQSPWNYTKAVESFPKQESVPEDGCGNWCRVPGRHHTRPHFAAAFNGEKFVHGAEAVSLILACTGDSPDLIPGEARPGERQAPPEHGSNGAYHGDDVFAIFNSKVSLDDVVRLHEAQGHRVVKREAKRVEFCRHGKEGKGQSFNVSAQDGIALTYSFTTNGGLPTDKGLTPSQVRCLYERGACDTATMASFAEGLRVELGLTKKTPVILWNGKPVNGPASCTSAINRDTRDRFSESGENLTAWGLPAPLPTMPAVPPFPLDVFPHAVASYWRHAAAALSVPVDYLAVPGMTLLGAAIGRSRAAEVKSSYTEVPCIWSAVIAPPGSAKSAALRFARAPLARAEARWMDEHRDAMSEWMVENDRHTAAMKEWKANECEGEPPVKQPRPTLRQATLDDTTIEAAAKVMNENPRGVALTKDELIAFVKCLNQYRSGGKGADREFWLSAWTGASVKVNRAKDHEAGPLYVAHPFASITGMLCPDSLAELRGENRSGDAHADGFLDRFLLSFPDPMDAVAETWRTIPVEVEQGYCDVFLNLLAMEMIAEPHTPTTVRHRPYFIKLSRSGRAAWEEFTGDIAVRMNSLDSFDPFKGVLSKLKGYAVRIATLLWCLRRDTGDIAEDTPIEADIIAGAAGLVAYYERHAARCLGRGWADRTSRIAYRMLAWLVRNPESQFFTRTDAYLALKDKRDVRSSDVLNPVFKLLIDHNYLRPIGIPTSGRPGPAPETYIVNHDWKRKDPETGPKSP